MFYQEILPSIPLRGFVKCFWRLEENESVEDPGEDSIAPDGCPEIVINIAGRFKRITPDNSVELQPRTLLVGQVSHEVNVIPTGDICLVGVRFRPDGAYPFMRQSVSELTDQILNLDLLSYSGSDNLPALLSEQDSFADQVRVLENFLMPIYFNAPSNILTNQATEMIDVNCGMLSVREVACALEVNVKTLERQFVRHVGVTPKLYSRIVRLQAVLRHTAGPAFNGWADTALTFGFTDQAHLIRDFKSITGSSPAEFVTSENKITDSFIS